eukprot:sb/3477815/
MGSRYKFTVKVQSDPNLPNREDKSLFDPYNIPVIPIYRAKLLPPSIPVRLRILEKDSGKFFNQNLLIQLQSDPDLGTPSGERLLSTKSGCPLNRGQIRKHWSLIG